MKFYPRAFLQSSRLFYSSLVVICIAFFAVVFVFHSQFLDRYHLINRSIFASSSWELCMAASCNLVDYSNEIYKPHADLLPSLHPNRLTKDSLLSELEALPGVRKAYLLQSGSVLLTNDSNAPSELADSLAARRSIFAKYANGTPKAVPKFDSMLRNRIRFTNVLFRGDTLRMILCAYDNSGTSLRILPEASTNPELISYLVALDMDPSWIKQSIAAHLEQSLYNREAFWLWSPPAFPGIRIDRGLGVVGLGDTLWWSGLKSIKEGNSVDWPGFANHPWMTFYALNEESPVDLANVDAEYRSKSFLIGMIDGVAVVVVLLLMFVLVLVRKQWLSRQTALSHLAHAIRTPVARLRLDVDTILAARSASPEQERQIVQAVGIECSRIERAVQNAVLSLEDKHHTMMRTPDDLALILRDALLPWQTNFASFGISLIVPQEAGPLKGRFDREMIATLLDNLLDNALRYSRLQLQRNPRQEQKVLVSLKHIERLAVLTVEDSNGGVLPADRQRIFRRFERGSDAAVTGASGLGLGLALVKEIADAHGGTVAVDDSPLGGARFTVRFSLDR